MATTASMASASPESLMSAPVTTPSSSTRLRTYLAIGCGVGLLLCAGVVLRRRLARPRPPPRGPCPMADNTIALLRDLHDGPFRFGDPTPFAVAARAEATRRIRRQQRERRRLRRRMRPQLCRARSSQQLPSWRAAATAAASAPVSNVLGAGGQQTFLRTTENAPAPQDPLQQGRDAPGNELTSGGAATATAKEREGRAKAEASSQREGALLPSANSATSLYAVDSDADNDDPRDNDGYDEGVYSTNGPLMARTGGLRKMTSSEVSLISSTTTMSSSYDSDYSRSPSTSSRTTTSGSSYYSRIITPSLMQSTGSSADSQGGASSLLAMTTGSVTSPDGIPWVKATLDGGSVTWGGLHGSHDAPQQAQQHSQHHNHQPPPNDPAGSFSNIAQNMVPMSMSNPQSSSSPHSMSGAMAAQGGRYPAQLLWCGASSPAPSIHACGGTPRPGANTTSPWTFGGGDGGGGDSSGSPEVAYTATFASVPGPAPSLLASGRWGGVAEDEESYQYTAPALMYGPPLFATEMDVTDALAELRSSVCCSGDRQGSSCLAGGASSTINTTPSPFMNSSVTGSGSAIMARINSSNNATSLHQQQLGMSLSSVHYRSQQQHQSTHQHTWSHPRSQGYFSGTSMSTASASVAFPTYARHTAHYPGGGSGSSSGKPPKHQHHHHRSSSGYHRVSSRTSVRRSANWSPASSQWLPETLSTVQPVYGYDSAPRGWGSGGSEVATGESTASGGNGSFTHAPTETPISQASSALRRFMTTGGRAHHTSAHGNINGNAHRSFRSVNSTLRHLCQRGRHCCSGRLRRCWRRCRRLVRRRVIASCAVAQLLVMRILCAVRRGSSVLGGACARGWRWVIRQWRESACAASGKVLAWLRRTRWSLLKTGAMAADETSCTVATSVPSSEAAKRHPGHTSTVVDTAAEAAAEAKRGGLLMTDTADEAINKIVQLLEPTPGRVPTVVVIRAPLGYDVSTDAASLWKALHLDSTSSEEGLIDIIIMEELKTGPLPPAQARAAAAATGTSSQVVSFPANPAAPPLMPPYTGTSDGERTTTTAAPAKPPTSPLQRRRPPPEPSKASAAAAATTPARAQTQLRISFEIYPAHLFYSLIFRAAVLQEKDWALRRAAAELFGGSAESDGSGKGLGVSAGANASAGGGVSVTPGSPLSLARALSFTFGVQAPAGDCGNNNNAMDPFSHHPHHVTAAVGGSATGLENYCLSPLSPGHFCRMPVSPKLTAPSPHVGLSGGGGAAAAAAGVGVANASPGTACGTVASPVTLPASAFSSVAVTTSPQVVVRLSESYSFPAQPPQMVMSPPLGTQPGFKAPLGALPADSRCSAYGGGGSAFSGAGAAGGASGIGVLPSGSAGRIISDNELLFYIHVLRTAVGDGVNTTALPSSRASEVDDDDADANSAGPKAAGVQRDGADPGKQSPRTPSGISDAALVSREGPDAVEDNDDDSEDLTLLDLRQREIEPQVLLRYRFRVFQQGCRSRKALDAVVLYTQDHVEPWYEEAKAMLQALPATESCQALSSLSTPSLRVNGSSPALRPSDSVGRMTSLGGGGEATTGVASGRPQRRSCPRPAGLPLLSIGTVALASTPELDQVDCRPTVANSGPLQLPAWAMEVLIRRESMRETLVRDLKEKAFRVCAVPLPDMRVHRILPPAVPRYVTAHARGFPLSRTFAEEVLSQQRALQFILLQREQENQRAIAARIRQEQRRQERRDRKRRERRAREEASRRAQQGRQQQKRSLNSRRRESGDGDSLKKRLTGALNPATVVSRAVSMVKRFSVGSAGRDFGHLFVRVLPLRSDSVRKTRTSANAAYRQESRAPAPLGEPDVPKTSPPSLPPPPYRHGYPAASGGFYSASSPTRRQSTAPEGNARVGGVLSQGESDRAGYGAAECRDATSAAAPTVGNARQHQRSTDEPSSASQVYAVQPPRGLQGMRDPPTAAVSATSVQSSPTLTEVDIHVLGGSSGSVSVEVSADVSLTANATGVSALSCAADAAPRSSERGAGGDTGGSGRGRAPASAGAPSPSPTSPTPYTATSPIMLLAVPQSLSGSPPPQPHSPASANGSLGSPPPQSQSCQGDHSGGGGSSSAPKPVSLASASSTRSSHWTAVHTATNANTCVTPPPPPATASAAGSPAVQVSSSGSNGGCAANAVGHGHAQMTPASVSGALQNHFGSSPASTATTSSSVSGASNTTPGFSGTGAAGFHSGTTSMSERGFPLMSLPPPPLPLPALSSSSPLALGAGTIPSSCVLSVPDAPTATLMTTRDASLDVSAGGHRHHQDTTVLLLLPQQPSNTSQPQRSVQNPASPVPATSPFNAEGATHLTVSGGTAQNHMSSRSNYSFQLPDDDGVPAASMTPMPLAVPNNSMYGTFDAYYGHSVVTPQAVLLRQQAQVAAAASVAPLSAMRALTSPRHRATANTAAPLSATVTLAAERDTRKGELHNGGCAGDLDVRGPAGILSSATSTPAAGAAAAAAAAAGGNAQQLPPPPPHLQAPRSGPRRTSSGLLPYTYSADSVSSMYGTTHYPLYQYPDDSNGAAAAAYTGVSPPTSSMPGAAVMGGGSSATTAALAGSAHAGASMVYTYKSSGCSSSHVLGVSATGVTQVYTSPGNSAALFGIGGAGRPENWSSHSQSPRVPDSPMDVNASAIAPLSLPLAQDTHMNRLKQYNKLLSDLLGVAGGPMRSGISFYYTYGDATALLYNASIRAPCDENILELLDRQQWEKQQELRQLPRTDGGSGGAFSDSGGASDSSTSVGDKIPMHTSSGSYSLSSSATDNTGACRVPVTLAGIGASPPAAAQPAPQLQATLHGSGSAAVGDANAAGQGVRNAREDSSAARAAAAAATEDEGCSYLEYGGLAGLQDTMDALESEQIEAQRARNTRFYSIFEHLHHAYHDTVLEAIGSGSAQPAGLSPVTAATGSLYAELTGGVGTEYFFPSAASAAGAAGAERHAASPHCVGHATAPGSVTPPPGLVCGGAGAADTVGLPRWRRRLWSRVCALVAWVGSLVGLGCKPRGDSAAVGAHTAGGATDSGVGMPWRSSQLAPDGAKCGFDPAKLAEYFPGERIVTFGDEWCIASRLDMHNGHFGLSPLQVWMATRYSRRFAGEVYLMDVIAAGGDPYYPAVRVLDEIVAHAVLYYHNHSLRDFVEDLEAELGLVYVPQTLWGRRALGLPDDDAEVQELEGLLYTATRRRQDRRRRQRAQEKYRQRRRCSDGAGGGFEKGRAAVSQIPLPTTAGASRSAAADRHCHTDGAPAPPPPPFPSLAADAAREGERQGGPTAGSRRDRYRSSSPQAPTISGTATRGSVGGASIACPLLPSPVSNRDDLPSVAAIAATAPANLPPPLQQHHRPRRHDNDRLEDEEMAEYTWIQLQGKDQEEDEEVFYGATAAAAAGLGGGDINIAPHVYDAVMEREVYDERMLLRELDHLKEFLVDNRNVLSSAMLTTAGSNSLEAVFGVPATVFPFLLCARESVPFVASIFESLSYHYGPLTYDNFSKYTYDVYHRDRPDVLRHTPRMFRMVNKSRRGCITYEELCRWMARKLSCGNNVQPNGHLLATSMSLRLPLALVAESRDEWDAYRCVLKSLSDGDDEEY